MRKMLLVGLVGIVAVVVAGCPCPSSQCPPEPPIDGPNGKVQVIVMPLAIDNAERCIRVDREEICAPGVLRMVKELPSEGLFSIDIGEGTYELATMSPRRAKLKTVYVVVGSTYVIGLYDDETMAAAGETGTCIRCAKTGAIVCGHNPSCR